MDHRPISVGKALRRARMALSAGHVKILRGNRRIHISSRENLMIIMALPAGGSLLETNLVSLAMIVIAVVFPLLLVALPAHFIGGSPKLLLHLLVLQALDVVGTVAISTSGGFGVAHQKLTTVDADAVFSVVFNVAVLASYGGNSSAFPGHGLMGKGDGEAEMTIGAKKILVNGLLIGA